MGIPHEFPSEERLEKFGVQVHTRHAAKARLQVRSEAPGPSAGRRGLQARGPPGPH